MSRIRSVKLLFTLAALSCASSAVLATGSSGPGVPAFLLYQTGGFVYVYFPNSIRSGAPPACAANIGGTNYRLVFDSTKPGGSTLLAGLIAAHEAGEGVWPDGTGDCGVDSMTESLKDFQTVN